MHHLLAGLLGNRGADALVRGLAARSPDLQGRQWFDGVAALRAKMNPRVVKATSTAEVDEIVGDGTSAYPQDAGLRAFVRRLYFLKPDVLIVVDRIEVDRVRQLELRFHTEAPCEEAKDGVVFAKGKKAALRIEVLWPAGVSVDAGPAPGLDLDRKPIALNAVRVRAARANWVNATALSWCAADGEAVKVSLEQRGDRWVFHAGERSVAIRPLEPGSSQ